MKKIHNRKYLREYRRELRNNMTDSEARLWTMLKNKGLKGRKFRRQHSIENYIVDFFSYEESLVIEIDGSSHDGLVAGIYDEIRQKRLEELGFKVLRFDAKDILHDLDRVIETIGQNFTK